MTIAIDCSPLESGHKVRGVGFYLAHLKEALLAKYPDNEYIFFTNEKEIPHSVDIIHYPYFDPFFITLPFFKKAKTVVTVHDLTPIVFPEGFPSGLRGKVSWEIQKLALKRCDGVITDSFSSKKDIEKLADIPPSRVHVAYLAAGDEYKILSQDKKERIVKKYNLPKNFALYVGDVTWNKNLPRLLEAINQTDIPLVLIGKALAETDFDRTNPWNNDRIKIEKLRLQNSGIYTLGFLPTEDVVALYNAATVFVMPSLYEGFGLPVIEAMQCGAPVVSGKGGSLHEVVGNSAYTIDSTSIESIKEGVKKVFHSVSLQNDLRKKGLEQASKFTWEQTAIATMKVYKSV